ncbi:MAG: nuclease-related domain-containing protein [Gammaproteobacteria bacterium]
MAAITPMLVAVCPVIIFGLLIEAVQRGEQQRQRRDPFTTEFLRPAGYSLQRRVDALQLDLALTFGFGLALPLWFYSVWLTAGRWASAPDWTGWLYFSMAVISFIFFLARTVSAYRTMSQVRLALDGEAATGQELDRLMRFGARVFHDMPAEEFNLDHVVVSAAGVMAVESLAHPRSGRMVHTEQATVRFDGRHLSFPDRREDAAVLRAREHARWLAEWLSRALHEEVVVQPFLSLPGWSVERQGLSDVMVLNPRDCSRYVQGKPKLSERMQDRIAFQIERACRNEKTRAQRRR